MITEFSRNASPDQLLLWRHASGVIAWNTIVPLYFAGAIAGSEFLVYNAAKLYICLDATFQYSTPAAVTNLALMTIRKEADVICGYYTNGHPVWDTTAAALKYTHNPIFLQNFYFCRIEASLFSYMKFNGYRLNIV